MSQSSALRLARRALRRITRRIKDEADTCVRPVSREVVDLVGEIERAAESEPEMAVESALLLLETLPGMFLSLDDALGVLGTSIDRVAALATDLLLETADDAIGSLDRRDVFERLFFLWVGDDSGYLRALDETMLASMAHRDDEAMVIQICREHLRHLPLVFPSPPGRKLELARSILESDRHVVERLLGEIYARRGRFDYAVVVARAHYRVTSDAVDYVEALARGGFLEEAIEVADLALTRTTTPRRAAVQDLRDALVARRLDDVRSVRAEEKAFLATPSLDGYLALRRRVAPERWSALRARVLDDLVPREDEIDLLFQIYVEEEMITEADGLVVTRRIDPHVLAFYADQILEEHTDRAAGWLLTASYRLVKSARSTEYKQAASWLQLVRRASQATGQHEAFASAIHAFRDRYRRRPALLRILDEHGL